MEESKQEMEPEVDVPKLDIPDLRQILKRQDEPRAQGLFSAAEFIALDDGESEAQKAEDVANDGSNLNGMHTEEAATSTANQQASLTLDLGSGDLS